MMLAMWRCTYRHSRTLVCTFMTCGLALVQVRNTPYMSMSERSEVISYHRRRAMEGDNVQAMLAATLSAVKRAGRRAGVGNMDRMQEKKANSAVSFFWNYNTVESVLLFCAVLVNLAGML